MPEVSRRQFLASTAAAMAAPFISTSSTRARAQESGKLGVVIEQHPKSLVTPKVKVFFSTKSRCQFMPEIIDLSDRHCEDKIVARESAEKWGLTHLDDLWNT